MAKLNLEHLKDSHFLLLSKSKDLLFALILKIFRMNSYMEHKVK